VTADDRRDLRIRYIDPKAPATEGDDPGVVKMDDYRNL
jgi:hypothetical protein